MIASSFVRRSTVPGDRSSGWEMIRSLDGVWSSPTTSVISASVATDAVDAHGLFLYTRSPLGGGSLAYALVGAVCVAVALFSAFRRKEYGAIPG